VKPSGARHDVGTTSNVDRIATRVSYVRIDG
jgi:hypothetical protein